MTVHALPPVLYYSAWDTANQEFIADDEANHSIIVSFGGAAPVTPTNTPVSVGSGLYELVLTAAERATESAALAGSSATENVIIQPVAYTAEPRLAGMTEPDTDPTIAKYTAGALVDAPVADVSGLATSVELAALQTHGDSNWGTFNDTALRAYGDSNWATFDDTALRAYGDTNWTTFDDTELRTHGDTNWGTADVSDVQLPADGLDNVLVAGVPLPEALRRMSTTAAGEISGAGSGTETAHDWENSDKTVVFTVDSAGNRTSVVYN